MLKGAFPLAAGFWAVRSDSSLGRWTDRQLVRPFGWLAASAFSVVSPSRPAGCWPDQSRFRLLESLTMRDDQARAFSGP